MSARSRETRRSFLSVAGGTALGASLLPAADAADPKAPRDESPGPRNEVITAITFIHGLPGREEDLRAHLLSLAAPTRAEAGCVNYDLYQSAEARHEFMRHEVWASVEALEVHKKAPHLKGSWEKRQREGWTTQITVWKRVIE